MQLLIIRHAVAVDRDDFTGDDDDLRPLTADGRRKMRRIATGLHRITARPDLLVTSPLVRARQTADIVGEAYDMTPGGALESLRPTGRFPATAYASPSLPVAQS